MSADADPQSGIPWGRRPVASIPLPPFTDRRDAGAFLKQLGLYVAALGDGEDVTAVDFALLAVVAGELDRAMYRDVDAWPSPAVLRVAVTTYFPAPWTPWLLNDTIGRVLGREQYGPPNPGDGDSLSWGTDPVFGAWREQDGSWTVGRSERGSSEELARIDGDDDMVLYRMSFERGHPFPFGWGYDKALLPPLDTAASSARTAWRAHAMLPYLADWQDELRRSRD